MFSISIVGHRGLGCTDSEAARIRNQLERRAPRPPENTLDSLLTPLRDNLAAAVETDAILTADGRVVLTHSNDPLQHIFTVRPLKSHLIGELPLAEVRQLRVGADGAGQIPTLRDLLGELNKLPDRGLVLHLELKSTQQTAQPDNSPHLIQAVLADLHETSFPLTRLRASSFSWNTLGQLRATAPEIAIGALFDVPAGAPFHGSAGTPIFFDSPEPYRDFSIETIKAAQIMIPGLQAVHPEIRTLSDDTVGYCAENRLAIATWSWGEQSPVVNAVSRQAAFEAIMLCRKHGVPLAIATDYATEMQELVAAADNKG